MNFLMLTQHATSFNNLCNFHGPYTIHASVLQGTDLS